MAWTMDLGPLVGLKKRMWRASFFTGLAGLHDAGVLIDLLSFSVRDAVEARLCSFGGDRQRWVVLGVPPSLRGLAVLRR